MNLSIYDLNGKLVAELLNQHKNNGKYSITWEGNNQFGQPVPSGIYVVKLSLEESSKSAKLVLMK